MIYVNIGYKNKGKPIPGGVTEYYPVEQQMRKMEEITNRVYNDIIRISR
jgi:hypothetical protein